MTIYRASLFFANDSPSTRNSRDVTGIFASQREIVITALTYRRRVERARSTKR